MHTYIIERIEWTEGRDPLDYKESRRVLHSFLELEAAKEYVLLDSEYYSFRFKWDGQTNKSYIGYEISDARTNGVCYQIRRIPHK